MLTGTYTRLKSGEWGIKVYGIPNEGDCVEIKTKNGATKKELVRKVLWSGQDKYTGSEISLCTKTSAEREGEQNSQDNDSGFTADTKDQIPF